MKGEVKVDESYFGATRVRGKTIVFGLLKREGKVYIEIVPNVTKAILKGIIRGKVELDSIIHSDGWRGIMD
jgi:transposase-like protein